MAVVHGRKQAVQGSSGVISHYTAIPAFSGDYSAFGVRLRGRGEGEYRYGFQDQEHDTETFRGGSVNYKYRMHRPDLGRFFSVDPLHKDYPWNSGYAFSENRVTNAIELEGLEAHDLGGGQTVYGPYVSGAEAKDAALSGEASVSLNSVAISPGSNSGRIRSTESGVTSKIANFINSTERKLKGNSYWTFGVEFNTTDGVWNGVTSNPVLPKDFDNVLTIYFDEFDEVLGVIRPLRRNLPDGKYPNFQSQSQSLVHRKQNEGKNYDPRMDRRNISKLTPPNSDNVHRRTHQSSDPILGNPNFTYMSQAEFDSIYPNGFKYGNNVPAGSQPGVHVPLDSMGNSKGDTILIGK